MLLSKKVSFEKKYPLFNKYFKNESIRNNMLANENLYHKYTTYENTIQIFILEMERFFDVETIQNMLEEVIVKLPNNVMISFIRAYLNSSDISKCNIDVLKFYNKTSEYGLDAIKYMEEHGIITNLTFNQINELIKKEELIQKNNELVIISNELNKEFLALKKGNEIFGEHLLSDLYFNLDIDSKKYINELLKKNAYLLFSDLFKDLNVKLNTLISIFISIDVNTNLLNDKTLDKISMFELLLLCYQLIEADDINITKKCIYLLENNDDLIKYLINNNEISYLYLFTNEDLITSNNVNVLNTIKKNNITLEKETN